MWYATLPQIITRPTIDTIIIVRSGSTISSIFNKLLLLAAPWGRSSGPLYFCSTAQDAFVTAAELSDGKCYSVLFQGLLEGLNDLSNTHCANIFGLDNPDQFVVGRNPALGIFVEYGYCGNTQ